MKYYSLVTCLMLSSFSTSAMEMQPSKENAQKEKMKEIQKRHLESAKKWLVANENEEEEQCTICKSALDVNECIVLHEASGSTSSKKIPHAYHAHCLWGWYKASNDNSEPVDDISANLKSKKRIKIGCPLCGGAQFDVTIGELCTKYSAYLNKLSLKQMLDNAFLIPKKNLYETLSKISNMETKEKNKIMGNRKNLVQKVQEITYPHFCDSKIFRNLKQTIAAIVIKIVGETDLNQDFLWKLADLIPQKKYEEYFKRAMKNTECLKTPNVPLHPFLQNIIALRPVGKIDDDLYASQLVLYLESANYLSEDIRIEYYDKMFMNPTSSDFLKKAFILYNFKHIPIAEQLKRFDDHYSYMSLEKDPKAGYAFRAQTLLKFKDALIEEKGVLAVTDMVCALNENAPIEDLPIENTHKLLDVYRSTLSPQDRFTLFSRIVHNYDPIASKEYVELIVYHLARENEYKLHINMLAQFIIENDPNLIMYRAICEALIKQPSVIRSLLMINLYVAILKQAMLDNDLTRVKRLYEETRQGAPSEIKEKVIRCTLRATNSMQLRDDLLKDGLTLNPQHAQNVINQYLNINPNKTDLVNFVNTIRSADLHNRYVETLHKWKGLARENVLTGLKAVCLATKSYDIMRYFFVNKLIELTLNEKIQAFSFLATLDSQNSLIDYNMMLRLCSEEEGEQFKEYFKSTMQAVLAKQTSQKESQNSLNMLTLLLSNTNGIDACCEVISKLKQDIIAHPFYIHAIALCTELNEEIWKIIKTETTPVPGQIGAKLNLLQFLWVQQPKQRWINYKNIFKEYSNKARESINKQILNTDFFKQDADLIETFIKNSQS